MINIIASGISEELLRVLEGQGLPVTRSLDLDVPPFPRDITLIDDQQLMILSSKYMENFNFLRTQVSCAALAEAEAEAEYEVAVSKALLTNTTGKSTEKANMLKASVIIQPEIVELSQKKMYTYAYRKLLETSMDNLERQYQLTSRELTRRTSSRRGF